MSSDVNVITSSVPLFNRLRTLVPECTWKRLDPRHCKGRMPDTLFLFVDAGDFLPDSGRSLKSYSQVPRVILLARTRDKEMIPMDVIRAASQIVTLPLVRQELLSIMSAQVPEVEPAQARRARTGAPPTPGGPDGFLSLRASLRKRRVVITRIPGQGSGFFGGRKSAIHSTYRRRPGKNAGGHRC